MHRRRQCKNSCWKHRTYGKQWTCLAENKRKAEWGFGVGAGDLFVHFTFQNIHNTDARNEYRCHIRKWTHKSIFQTWFMAKYLQYYSLTARTGRGTFNRNITYIGLGYKTTWLFTQQWIVVVMDPLPLQHRGKWSSRQTCKSRQLKQINHCIS